jgi:hypothetical protein
VVARKTKRAALVAALSASLVVGGAAAFAHDVPEGTCPRGNGKGLGHGHPGGDKGKGLDRGWPHKNCDAQDENGGGNPGGGTPGADSTPGGGGTGDNGGISVEVDVEVNLPYVSVPDVTAIVGGVVDQAVSTADQTVTLAESEVANLMRIAQAGVSLSGSGTVNVSGRGYLLSSVLAAI